MDQKALAKLEKAIGGIMAVIAVRPSQVPADAPDVHPNITVLCRLLVKRFTEALDDPDEGRQGAEALRSSARSC